jgi:hypothetical protein
MRSTLTQLSKFSCSWQNHLTSWSLNLRRKSVCFLWLLRTNKKCKNECFLFLNIQTHLLQTLAMNWKRFTVWFYNFTRDFLTFYWANWKDSIFRFCLSKVHRKQRKCFHFQSIMLKIWINFRFRNNRLFICNLITKKQKHKLVTHHHIDVHILNRIIIIEKFFAKWNIYFTWQWA